MKYSSISLIWFDPDFNSLIVHDKTIEEALENAVFFGYKPPKWWQFWKDKIMVQAF